MNRVFNFLGVLLVISALLVACSTSDTTDPTVTITSPIAGTIFGAGDGITVAAAATDNVAVIGVTVRLGDQAPVTASLADGVWSVRLTAPAFGEYTITAAARDAAGNTALATVDITVVEPIVGAANGAVERVPPLGSGKPGVTPAALEVGGFAADLLARDAVRGSSPDVQSRGMPALDRIIVSFESPRFALPASAGASEMARWEADVDRVAADFRSYGVASGQGLIPGLGIAVFDVAPGSDVSAAVASLSRDTRIRHVEQDSWVFATKAPDDSMFDFQWAHELTDAQVAWETSTSAATVRVAVVDSGSAAAIGSLSQTGEHPDLVANLIPGFDFVSGVDLEAAQNWVSTEAYRALKSRFPQVQYLDGDQHRGWDEYPLDEFNTTYDPGTGGITGLDDFGSHGTHVAGIIGAVGNDGWGVAGVAWNVEIQPLRALGHTGSGLNSDVLAAVAYAAGFSVTQDGKTYENPTPANIINLSLGSTAFSQEAADLYAAVRAKGVLVVAAAGNDSSHLPYYPSGYDGVISVSSVDYIHWVDELNGPGVAFSDFFSNWGSTIDIAAPGGLGWATAQDFNAWELNGLLRQWSVISTGWRWFDSTDPVTAAELHEPIHYYSAGTSMSAPYVAGAAALLLGLDPTLTADALKAILTGTASRVDDGHLEWSYGAPKDDWDPFFGHGVIDLAAAIEAVKSGVSARIPAAVYVEAVNVRDPLNVLRVAAEPDLTFEFGALPAGTWRIRAGVDSNGNGRIGDGGEYYGEFATTVTVDRAQPVTGDVSFILERTP